MRKIYSKQDPTKLLHLIFHLEDWKEGRQELVDDSQPLQVAAINPRKGQRFQLHYHLPQNREIDKTCELWIVMQGSVLLELYDTNNTLLEKQFLMGGELYGLFSEYAAHTYKVLEDNTLIYEIKQGPYFGIQFDKEKLE